MTDIVVMLIALLLTSFSFWIARLQATAMRNTDNLHGGGLAGRGTETYAGGAYGGGSWDGGGGIGESRE